MLNKTIVGVDGSQGGEDAIALARALAPDAELVLACAYGFDETTSRFAVVGYGDALRAGAADDVRRAREAAGVPGARIELLASSSPAHALHRLAESEHADLLVVGSSRHGRLGRALLGDVARAALHGAPCPVAVAPRGYVAAAIHDIGVGFDGSAEAGEALRFAAGIAASLGTALRVRTAVDLSASITTTSGYSFNVFEVLESLKADARKTLEEAVAGIGDVAVDSAVVGDSVALAMDELSRDVDLMVTGSRGWGALRRVVLGSTSDRLIHHAPCPVVVVPRSAVSTDAAPAPDQLAAATD
jgi:nucleotide-binding universal stress UspA family protein